MAWSSSKEPATLQETTDWIVSHLPEAGYFYTREGATLVFTFEVGRLRANFDGCKMTFEGLSLDTASRKEGVVYSDTSRISQSGTANLKLMSAPTLQTLKAPKIRNQFGPPEVFEILLASQSVKEPAFAGSIMGHYEHVGEPPRDGKGIFQPTYRLSISFTDRSRAEQVMKAFTHAITLCGGGKKEPF